MSRVTRSICKTLDQVASNNEHAALAMMRATDCVADDLLKQHLFNLIHRLNQDAVQLRLTREAIAEQGLKRA